MNYLDNLRPASFRGVSFLVPSDESGFGRRIETHEYPNRDKPYHEDLGQAPDSFMLEAVVSGDDFITRADALETAIKARGQGQLIHPHYGLLHVVAIDGRRRHDAGAVGEIRFSITFRRYHAPVFPSASVNTASTVMTRAGNLMKTVTSGFADFYAAEGLPDFVATAASGVLSGLETSFKNALGRAGLGWLSSVISMPGSAYDTGSITDAVLSAVGSLKDAGAPAIRSPLSGLAAVTQVAQKKANPAIIADAMLALADEVPAVTLGTARRDVNADQMNNLVRASAVSSLATATAQSDLISRERAIARRNGIVTVIDNLREDLAALDMGGAWTAASDLKTAVVRDINERLGRLPRTVYVNTGQSLPSIVLAHRLYGTDKLFDAASDLARRNGVRHPGFMPSTQLEVLVNA